MKEACGVFAVYAPGYRAAQLTFDGLYSLQHRGQESAGMAVSDGELVTVVKERVGTGLSARSALRQPGQPPVEAPAIQYAYAP